MAQLRTTEEVFEAIHKAAKESHAAYDYDQYPIFVENEIDQWRRIHSFMDDATVDQFFQWRVTNDAHKKHLTLAQPKPTAEQFWEAAYSFDPHNAASGVTELQRILSMKDLDSVPLGRLYGVKLELIPGMGALPTTDDSTKITNLPYAQTDSSAIAYSDGHPSEFDEISLIIKDVSDNKLRRFASLGWVIHVRPDNSWARTGHVLVMDMDLGRDHHHGWFWRHIGHRISKMPTESLLLTRKRKFSVMIRRNQECFLEETIAHQ